MKEAYRFSPIALFWTLFCIIAIAGLMYFAHIGLSWAVVACSGCYALSQVWRQGYTWWKGRHLKVGQRERMIRMLVSLMGLLLVTGTALFLYAFYLECWDSHFPGELECRDLHHHTQGEVYEFVNAEYLFRSVVCSLGMFMLNVDSNVLDGIKEHYYLKGLISIHAIFSFLCTMSMVITLAFARVKAYIKYHRHTTIDRDHNHLYVFFGMNEPSHLLAKSIREKEQERAVILFVEKSDVDEDDQDGWNSIVDIFTHKKRTFVKADEIDARVTFTETRLCDIDREELAQSNILDEVNLRTLRKIILKMHTIEQAELHVFFLSQNEDENIRSLSLLAEDETICAGVGRINQVFYCHARRNGLNRVVEDASVRRGLEVHIIDSSNLAVEVLKANEVHHPVRLMEIDKENPTTVKSAFHGLIVGFDEVGQDTFRFLYEFGALVDSQATPEGDYRIPFHCTIVDSKLKEKKGLFKTFAPAVFGKTPPRNVSIDFRECDCTSEAFYELFSEDFRNNLNYVVIAVGNDELGMTCAIRIFNYVRQCREDLSRLRIFVRSYKTEKEDYMQKIASHYNNGYSHEKSPTPVIIPFGQQKQVYTYDMIVRNRFVMDGRRFMEGYARMKNDKELWDDRRKLLLGHRRKEKDDYGNKHIVEVPLEDLKISIDDLRSLRRKETQDIANAIHAGTKLYLLRQAFGKDCDWRDFLYRYFEPDGQTPYCVGSLDSITYPGLTPQENQAILNLARLEHLRWNASHEMLGYVKAKEDKHGCDERERQHNCLRPWEELDAESKVVTAEDGWNADYKAFDYGVVDFTHILGQ